jgi:manganese efflux pump family protein
VLALLLVAASLGLSNFAASIAIGMSGVDRHVRLRVALAFGLFEAGMPIVGLLVGRRAADALGSHAHLIAGLLLIATGASTVIQALRATDASASAASLSIDNLIVGFGAGRVQRARRARRDNHRRRQRD